MAPESTLPPYFAFGPSVAITSAKKYQAYQKAAANGDAEAAYLLALHAFYEEDDPQKAEDYFRKAHYRGHVRATWCLGMLHAYRNGEPEQDEDRFLQGIAYLSYASIKGVVEAGFHLYEISRDTRYRKIIAIAEDILQIYRDEALAIAYPPALFLRGMELIAAAEKANYPQAVVLMRDINGYNPLSPEPLPPPETKKVVQLSDFRKK